MRFYTKTHQHYCGIDLHAEKMFVCILDADGKVVLHRNIATAPEDFLMVITPFRDDLVVGVECMFAWYWLADLCSREKIDFVLGHALYMKAVHGGKVKNDKVDSQKIAGLLRGGMFPMAYVYPPEMRATRDLLRRRCFLVRRRADLFGHDDHRSYFFNNAFASFRSALPSPPFLLTSLIHPSLTCLVASTQRLNSASVRVLMVL